MFSSKSGLHGCFPRGSVLVASLLFAPPSAAGRFAVNCDAGDDLQATLDQAATGGGGRIHVTGTCSGLFNVTGSDAITVLGDSPASATIDGTVLVRSPADLTLLDLSVIGGGVSARGADSGVKVRDCALTSDAYAVTSSRGAFVEVVDSTISSESRGISVNLGGWVQVSRVVVRGQGAGATANSGNLTLTDVDLRDSFTGVIAENGSNVTVTRGTFSSGGFHFRVSGGSRLELHGPLVGGPDDAPRTLDVEGRSYVQIYEPTEIWGLAGVEEDSYVSIAGTYHGTIRMDSFSRLKLDGPLVDGAVICETAADVVCGARGSAQTFDCPSATASCAPETSGGN